jgi:hypothetical protein
VHDGVFGSTAPARYVRHALVAMQS